MFRRFGGAYCLQLQGERFWFRWKHSREPKSSRNKLTTRCDHHLNLAQACSFCHFKINSAILFFFNNKCVWTTHMPGNRAPYRPSCEQLRSNKETPCNLNTQSLTKYDKLQKLSFIVPAVMSRGVAAVAEFLCDKAAIDTARYTLCASKHSCRRYIRLHET